MYEFLHTNRDELIERCRVKVATRPPRVASAEQLKNGVALFLDQLTSTLLAERHGRSAESMRISGAAGGDSADLSEIGRAAKAHGKQLMELGYSVDDVVHGYGDLCQAIGDLAVERNEPFLVEEYRTLNRCLDNAIADAVTEFGVQTDAAASRLRVSQSNQELGSLLHELRNSLHTGMLALTALETGQLPFAGATGAVLRRSLVTLSSLVGHALEEVSAAAHRNVISLASFVADAAAAAALDADARQCVLTVGEVDPKLEIEGDRELLLGALTNLLHNAFKFTRPQTVVTLNAYAGEDGTVSIDVQDQCGGLPPGVAELIFKPFTRRHEDKSGLGLGLTIARKSVEGSGGTLAVRDIPGTGCVFTMRLRRHHVESM
jgi:signal transduction histidine kinase